MEQTFFLPLRFQSATSIMQIENILQDAVIAAIKALYQTDMEPSQITLQKTKKSSGALYTGHFPAAEDIAQGP